MFRGLHSAILILLAGTWTITANASIDGEAPSGKPGSAGTTIEIADFRFTGNSLFDDETLSAILLHYLQRPVSLDEIFTAADELEHFYRKKGYGLASVTVPPQDVTDGFVQLEVIEGRIGGIRVSGNQAYELDMLLDRMPGTEPGKPLNTRSLQRQLLFLSDLPGLDVRATISPGLDYGYSDIELRTDEVPWRLGIMLDDYGRDSLGERRATLDWRVNNPFGLGDSFGLALMSSEDGLLRYANLEYSLTLTRGGSRLGLAVNRADYEAGEEFAALGVVGENNFARLNYSVPLYRSRTTRFGFNMGVSRFETRSEITALPLPATESDLDLGELGLTFEYENRGSLFLGALSVSGNGEKNQTTLLESDVDAQRARISLDLKGSRAFSSNWWVRGDLSSAWSRETLVDSQQFSVGGPFSVRGYEPAVARGDAGFITSLELHRYVEWFSLPGSFSLQLDSGRTYRRLLPGEPDYSYRGVSLSSGGLGLKLGNSSGFRLELSAHHPIGNAPEELNLDESTKYWAGIGYSF